MYEPAVALYVRRESKKHPHTIFVVT